MRGFRIAALSTALFIGFTAASQDVDSFKRQFEEFQRSSEEAFSDFRRQCNDSYADFVQGAWKRYEAVSPLEKPEEKKTPPVVYEEEKAAPKERERLMPVGELVLKLPAAPRPQPLSPVKEKLSVREQERLAFDFFGLPVSIRAGEDLKFALPSTSGSDISAAWKRLSGSEYDNTLYDCLGIKAKYDFCDWAYLMMVFSFADKFLGRGDAATLMAAYLLSQSGYKMRLGLSENGLALLFGTRYQIYGVPRFEIDGEYFFQFQGTDTRMEIVDYGFPDEKPLSLAIESEQAFGGAAYDPRALSLGISCSVRKNLLKFYSIYPSSQLEDNPMTRWALYANTPLSGEIRDQIYPSLRSKVEGKSEVDAAAILLDFVRKSLVYKTDDDVWGYDRPFFCEETLHYPYSDCEDRAILYSRLVRDLLGLEVILVHYPGHLATAVRFPESEAVKGDCIAVGPDKYTVCDPSYEGAPVGRTMPGMDNLQAGVIVL